MPELRVCLVQMRCEKGGVDANLATIEAYLRDAANRDAEIVCFPEASVTGYVDPTRYPESIARLDGPEVARFVAMTAEMPLMAIGGIIEANPGGKPFITQIIATRGRLVGYYRKRTIPPDERHLFAAGSHCQIFTHPKATFGIAICADIDNSAVFAEAAGQGALLIFEAAAPGLFGPQETRDWRAGFEWWRGECMSKVGAYARDQRITIAVATQAGRTSDEDFPGGGYVFTPDGECHTATPDWSEGSLYATIHLGV